MNSATTSNSQTLSTALQVPSTSTQPTLRLEPIEEPAEVCCGCRPAQRRWRKVSKSISTSLGRSTKYYDAPMGGEEDWDKESLFFFDAEQEPLGDDEYPIVFTNSLQHPKPLVSLEQPESLLRHDDTPSSSFPPVDSDPIENHKMPSGRFHDIARRSTLENQRALEAPRVKVRVQGYPGKLTVAELAECQKFLRGIKAMDPSVREQVYSLRDVEEQPYTVCRWLRATKFDAAEILERIEANQDMFMKAREEDFYPDVAETIGAPFPVYLTQYPFLPVGRGKNGCPVNYFLAGRINPEGILAMTTIPRIEGYYWWTFMYKFKQEIRKAQSRDPDFVRIEGINVIDLSGLSASALSFETMEVIKIASKISDFFPETLHCMLVLNAPGFFALTWNIIKKFIDPRTAARIQIFSSEEKGLHALKEMVDVEEIPVDYGGTNKSIKQAFTDEAGDPTLLRQEVMLIHVKKRGKTIRKESWELQANEYAEIRAYTRSVSAANISVMFNGDVYKTTPLRGNLSDEKPGPHSVVMAERLVGPCTVTMEAHDLDTADKKYHGKSRGYFLITADVRRS